MQYYGKMVVDDIQFLSILKGKRIKLTLKNASYLGIVQRINPNKTIILADVVGANNGCRYPGSKMFFGHDIVNVEFTNEEHGSRSIQENKLEDHLTVERFQPYRRAVGLDDDDEEDDEEYINFVVIDEFHEKFGPAVMHIKKQQVIGVGADGVEIYKHGRLCWLQIATKNKVYLFDILLLGARAFKNGLSMILESKHILKVADVMCFYSETGGLLPDRVSTLQEVISLHLKVPSSQLLSLQMKSQLTQEEKEMWYKRPCPLPLLKVMALSVIHLQPLRLVLLDTLMTDYMVLVDSYLKSSHYQPDELEHLSMESVLELPKELRQLEQMRCDRQEWAAEQYSVTEQGLLDRFNPQTSKSSAEREMQALNQEDLSKPESESIEASFVQSVTPHASLCVGRGHIESPLDTNKRGVSPGNSSFPLLPGIGRGFLLQTPPAQIPGESAGDMTSSVNNEKTLSHSESSSSINEANVAPKSLSQSFRSFRD